MEKFEAIFGETTETITLSGLYQWDFGQKLYFKVTPTPQAVEVHFTNCESKDAIVMVATAQNGSNVVDIPNKLLEENRDIYAYIYYTQAKQGKTVKRVILKVEGRKKPQDFTSTNPDATTILGDVVNKINQNIADNKVFKEQTTQAQNQFIQKVETTLANKDKLSVSSYLTNKNIDDIFAGTYTETNQDEPNIVKEVKV